MSTDDFLFKYSQGIFNKEHLKSIEGPPYKLDSSARFICVPDDVDVLMDDPSLTVEGSTVGIIRVDKYGSYRPYSYVYSGDKWLLI